MISSFATKGTSEILLCLCIVIVLKQSPFSCNRLNLLRGLFVRVTPTFTTTYATAVFKNRLLRCAALFRDNFFEFSKFS